MESIDVIRCLCKEKGISLSKLEEELGFSNGSLAKAKTLPSDRTLSIAKYFGVTMEYITSGDKSSKYYHNSKTAEKAQKMYEDSDMRSLYDMKQKMSPERFSAHVKFMKELYEEENPSE